MEAVGVLFPYLIFSVSLAGLEHYFIALLLSVYTVVDGYLSPNMLVLWTALLSYTIQCAISAPCCF